MSKVSTHRKINELAFVIKVLLELWHEIPAKPKKIIIFLSTPVFHNILTIFAKEIKCWSLAVFRKNTSGVVKMKLIIDIETTLHINEKKNYSLSN